MPLAISIHIGVDDPGRDCCSGEVVDGMESTAAEMARLAAGEKFNVRATLTGAGATHEAVTTTLRAAADELNADREGNGILFLSFSGHGCQTGGLTTIRESDRLNETWCLSDRSISDDEVHDLLKAFKNGIRILVITESCHSGGSIERPIDRAKNLQRLREEGLLFSPADAAPRPGRRTSCFDATPIHSPNIDASVLVLAACAENQKARPGLFSGHLLDEWSRGFQGNYCQFRDQIAQRVSRTNPGQTPTIFMLGTHRPSFARQRPFSTALDV